MACWDAIPGADGMKTGFTCPAGYNLVASATHGGQKLIAVVLGAPSANARTAKAASLLDRAFQTGSPMGTMESLPSFGPGGAAPDMRESVCHHRAKANQEFIAEVEDMTIPITAAPTGNPVVDALAGGRQQVSVKDLAQLPRPLFEPVQVYAGRAPGYQGPVARARRRVSRSAPRPDMTAYSGEKSEAARSRRRFPTPRRDAKPLRGATARSARRQAWLRPKKPAARSGKTHKPSKPQAGSQQARRHAQPKHADKPQKAKPAAAKTSGSHAGKRETRATRPPRQ